MTHGGAIGRDAAPGPWSARPHDPTGNPGRPTHGQGRGTTFHRPSGRPVGMKYARLVLAPVLALAACAPVEPPLSYPPSARERILRIAVAEWRDWGAIVLDGAASPADPPESRTENFPRVLAYWRAVPDEEGAIARNRARYREGASGLWSEPAWSAAFISYVMRSAGVDSREFPSTAAHSTYVDALVADAARFPAAAPFIPHEPAAYAPRPGDLVCADRSDAPITSWRARTADQGRFRPMHCDIVIRARPGHIEAIGGNVQDAVSLLRFPTGPSGVLLPRPAGGAVWFAVFENRIGRLPPFTPSPTDRSPAS